MGHQIVCFLPLARYHAEEMSTVATTLMDRGIDCRFLIHDEFRGAFDDLLVEFSTSGPDGQLAIPSGASMLFTMNDWGTVSQPLVLEAQRRRITTVARVEGVQDFDDVDTGRERRAYLRADHVLAQGQNDVDALNRKNVTVVGNQRLEQLFLGPERDMTRSGVAVINSNFTFGVLTEHRRAFLADAVAACRHVGLRPVISQHPKDRELPPRFQKFRSEARMADLLPTADVLISRFSTVPFEAMAIGTPFVYFNPHGELVPAFRSPNRAFPTATSLDDLSNSLKAQPDRIGRIRQEAREFFLRQVDIDEDPSDARTADAVLKLLASIPGE